MNYYPQLNGITPNILIEQLQQNPEKVILVDCRSNIEYETSHISKAVNIGGSRSARREIINGQTDVYELLLKTVKLPNISDDVHVIVYDQSLLNIELIHQQSLLFFIAKGLQWKLRNLKILQGGFIGFQSQFKEFCWISSRKMPDEDFVTPLSRSVTALNEHSQTTTVNLLKPSHSNPLLPGLSGSSSSSLGPTAVLPHLLLGSQNDAMNASIIQQFSITHIINVSINGAQSPHIPSQHFLRIPILDNFCDKILDYFNEAFIFLDAVRDIRGRALVHCSAGISRSPTLAIGYLMRTYSMSLQSAYEVVKSTRSSVSPNFNFMGQLTDYESRLKLHQSDGAIKPKKVRPTRLPLIGPTNTQKLITLNSPSSTFAKMGIYSPCSPHTSLHSTIDSFPATSLELLTFQPCQAALQRGLRLHTKRSSTTQDDSEASTKIRRYNTSAIGQVGSSRSSSYERLNSPTFCRLLESSPGAVAGTSSSLHHSASSLSSNNSTTTAV